LASKAREALFSFFGESDLPPINNSATSTEITAWKKKKEVALCYNKLFTPKDSLLSRILANIFMEGNPSNAHVAYVTAIYSTMLDPKSQGIQANENAMKDKIRYFLVSYHKFINLFLKIVKYFIY
jgi:hypothetical protein